MNHFSGERDLGLEYKQQLWEQDVSDHRLGFAGWVENIEDEKNRIIVVMYIDGATWEDISEKAQLSVAVVVRRLGTQWSLYCSANRLDFSTTDSITTYDLHGEMNTRKRQKYRRRTKPKG